MSSEQIQEFIDATNADRTVASKYIQRNDYDVHKAIDAYLAAHPNARNEKQTTWYAGGSKSGIAMIAPGTGDQPNEEEARAEPIVETKTAFSGSARTLDSAPRAPRQAPPMTKPAPQATHLKTDFSVAGQPKTRIRFEFPDRPAQMLSVSIKATIGDLKSYIHENCSELSPESISLACAAPAKQLANDSSTVEAENLKQAIIKVAF